MTINATQLYRVTLDPALPLATSYLAGANTATAKRNMCCRFAKN